MKLACISLLLASLGAAHAGDDAPIALAPLPAPAAPATAPKLKILAPAMDAVMTGKQTRAADSKFDNLECLQDAKTFVVKVAAENWPVKPGGAGVLIVVDGVYATVTHDLAKPVKMADLEPYERPSDNGSWATYGPMFACGEHWVAVVPTTADGRMVRVAPVVHWWRNIALDRYEGERVEDPEKREGRLARAMPIVNWPLLGSLYIGTGWNGNEDEQRSGRVLADPKKPVLDWTSTPGDGTCELEIAAQDSQQSWTHTTKVPAAGAITLPPSFVGQTLAFSAGDCHGGLYYFAKLWAKSPPPVKSYSWPAPGSAQAEDYWHSDEGHAQFTRHVEHQREKCDNGEGDCRYGHTKPKAKPRR